MKTILETIKTAVVRAMAACLILLAPSLFFLGAGHFVSGLIAGFAVILFNFALFSLNMPDFKAATKNNIAKYFLSTVLWRLPVMAALLYLVIVQMRVNLPGLAVGLVVGPAAGMIALVRLK